MYLICCSLDSELWPTLSIGITGVEVRKTDDVGHFWNFDQVSLIIVDRALTVEFDHSFS